LDRERQSHLKAIDLGAGCGGWIAYLQARSPQLFSEVALADSSIRALNIAGTVLGTGIRRYQVDLLSLPWQDRWDVAFLLDVLEHIPADAEVLNQIHTALRPGGYLFVTTPALRCFWTYNDDLSHHVRRYSRQDFARLAKATGFTHCRSRYFMFFLSPLLLLSRRWPPNAKSSSRDAMRAHQERSHRVPTWPLNGILELVFSSETPFGWWCPFPWGTSILGVFQKNA
jgi:SAM-dependent methyltransferase